MGEIAPSERELQILKVLWELGQASVRQVLRRLAPNGELHFNTVQTQLRIMERKELVEHHEEARTFIYRPLHTREQVSSRFLHQVFDGALDQLVLSMLHSEDISPEELKEIEQLIARAREQKQKKTPKRAP